MKYTICYSEYLLSDIYTHLCHSFCPKITKSSVKCSKIVYSCESIQPGQPLRRVRLSSCHAVWLVQSAFPCLFLRQKAWSSERKDSSRQKVWPSQVDRRCIVGHLWTWGLPHQKHRWTGSSWAVMRLPARHSQDWVAAWGAAWALIVWMDACICM